jgi:hypothetical protein
MRGARMGSGFRCGARMAGPVVCCIGGTDAEAVQFCKDYIYRYGYTREQVKIVQKNYMTMVVALVRLW